MATALNISIKGIFSLVKGSENDGMNVHEKPGPRSTATDTYAVPFLGPNGARSSLLTE